MHDMKRLHLVNEMEACVSQPLQASHHRHSAAVKQGLPVSAVSQSLVLFDHTIIPNNNVTHSLNPNQDTPKVTQQFWKYPQTWHVTG